MSRMRELVRDVRRIMRPPAGASRFVTYFGLLEAFQEPGCPVCNRLEQGALKALDGLMYEQVNDPYTRDRLSESHGFCNWHAWMLPRIHNSALGVALIYRQLLDEALERLQATRREARVRGRWQRLRIRVLGARDEALALLAWRQRRRRCYLCAFARRSEHDDLTTILDFAGEPEFGEALSRSAGLCLAHLAAAMAIGRDHPNLPRLLAVHEARWRDLSWELGEFARKFDYRYEAEAKGRESSSWQRVLDVFAGRAGVFGPERGEEAVPPAPAAAPPGAAAAGTEEGSGPPSDLEALRFENEKLRRRVEELLTRHAEDQRLRQALEFEALKLRLEIKGLGLGADPGARAGAGAPEAPPEPADPPGGASAST